MNEFEEVEGGAVGVELPDVDVEGGEGLSPESSGGKGGGGSMVFIVAVVLILAFQAVSSHFIVKQMFFSKPPQSKKVEKTEDAKEMGMIFRLSGLIINPSESRGSKHLLLEIGLETQEANVISELEKIDPMLRDNLNTFFSAQRLAVLQDISYREKLRKRVQEIVNYHLTEGTVDEVFFIQYVLQ